MFLDIFHAGDKPCGGLIGRFVGANMSIVNVTASLNIVSTFSRTGLIIGEIAGVSFVSVINTRISKLFRNDTVNCLTGYGEVDSEESSCVDDTLPSQQVEVAITTSKSRAVRDYWGC